jgi:hypothetical protein
MKFPLVIVPDLTDRQIERYEKHINSDESGWHRKWTESIWRRHQDPVNARQSGWAGESDQRRRLIHFYDEYGVHGRGFALLNGYLWVNLTLPDGDIEEYHATILERLELGEWDRCGLDGESNLWRRGDLEARLCIRRIHPEDEKRGRTFPASYHNLELSVHTRGYRYPESLAERPWRWFYEVGLRKSLTRGKPECVEPEALSSYFPAQLELGCGPSTEAGIPHLSTLHKIYGVSRPDFSFVFSAKDDAILDVLSSPEQKYLEMTDIYRACMVAEATPFFRSVLDLWNRGLLVGPVITNNFDCLCADLGLPEMSLRRYDTEPYFPMSRTSLMQDIEFDPRAKSLLVVGVHADRRLAQIRARERGLKVLFIDPERYIAPDGTAIPYPVEAPQDADAFVRLTAAQAMPRLHRALVDGESA